MGDELTVEECQAEIVRIGKLFDQEQFNLNQLFGNSLVVLTTQTNSIVQLLIKKELITEEEANVHYFNLFASRMKEWEETILPQIREQRLRAQILQNGQVQQNMEGLLGPDGKPLF